VLDQLVIHLLEAELLIVVFVVVKRDAVEATAARVVFGGTPVEANRALRVEIGDPGAKAEKRRRVVDLLDRRGGPFTRLRIPFRQLEAAAQRQKSPRRPDGQQC
jgi:hypothetical protein